jgi:hypothetical protein
MLKRLSLLVLVALFLAVLPLSAFAITTAPMDIQGEGGQTGGTYTGGTTDWHNLTSDDGNTSILTGLVTGGSIQHCYDMADFVTPYSSIDGVTLGLRLFDWATGAVMLVLMAFLLIYNIWIKYG